jgi:hypothetical protein
MPGFQTRKAELRALVKLLAIVNEGSCTMHSRIVMELTKEELKLLELLEIRLNDSRYYTLKKPSRKSDEIEQDLV